MWAQVVVSTADRVGRNVGGLGTVPPLFVSHVHALVNSSNIR